MKRIQCRVCYEFMDVTLGRTCSENCERIARNRDQATVMICRSLEIERIQKYKERKKKKEDILEKQRLKRAEKSRNRNERRMERKRRSQQTISQQAKKIRALKQGRTENGFYEKTEWRDLRYRVLRHWGRTCMLCGATRCELHVDHIKPRSKFPDIALEFDNLQVLCRPCNMGKSNKDETDWRPTA